MRVGPAAQGMRGREDRGNGRGGVSGGKKARFSGARGWGRVGKNRDFYCIGDFLGSGVCGKRKIIDAFGWDCSLFLSTIRL